ncbi:MAG: hypothetical protein AB7O39_00860 [Flavobacteriaceae bacterium]
MKGDMHFSTNADGHATAKGANPDLQILAFWLSDDMPHHGNTGAKIETHALQMSPFAYHGMGNDFGKYQFGDYVLVRSETDRLEEMQILLTAQQVGNLFNAYNAFLKSDRRPTTIEVEYIATGKEAKTQFEKLAGRKIGKPRVCAWLDKEKAAEAAAKGGA